MPDLFDAFNALPISLSQSESLLSFQTIPVILGLPHCLAKSDKGHPHLLIVTRRGDGFPPPPIRLEHLSVQHGLSGTVHGPEGPSQAEFSLVALNSPDAALVQVFLRFAEHLAGCLPDQPQQREVALEIRRLVEMLQNLRHKGLKTIQGLWAELFLIERMDNPGEWVDGWHNDPMELHDFCLETFRVEVKSSSTHVRKHHFSHRQLYSPPGTALFIASVFAERIPNGKSVHDLATDIRCRLNPENAFKLDETMVSTLGVDYQIAQDVRFDKRLAETSLRFFDSALVPRMPENLPDRIFDLSYAILLNELEGLHALPIISA